jgi:hypothetical protein
VRADYLMAYDVTFVSVSTASIKPFQMIYQTDGTEAAVVAAPFVTSAIAVIGNTGFCLNYQEN